MREIKFRIWNGAEMVCDVTVGKFGVFYVNPSNNGLDPNDSASLTPFTTKYDDDTPLMQFTGLKDKNGVEIYEGDIIRFKVDFPEAVYDNGMVRWADGGYWTSQTTDDLEDLLSEELRYLEGEVIGNIYEHPYLLK